MLNRLPPSTIHTTPHLVQTRASLLLSSSPSPPEDGLPTADRKRLAHERALVRFGRATKEVDGLVARVYVGLAELEEEGAIDEVERFESKEKEKVGNDGHPARPPPAVEDRAVNRYLDDAAWESATRAGPSSLPPISARSARGLSKRPAARSDLPNPVSTPLVWAFGWFGPGSKRSTAVGGTAGFIKLG